MLSTCLPAPACPLTFTSASACSLGVGNPYLRDVRINVPVTDPDFNNASAVMDCQSRWHVGDASDAHKGRDLLPPAWNVTPGWGAGSACPSSCMMALASLYQCSVVAVPAPGVLPATRLAASLTMLAGCAAEDGYERTMQPMGPHFAPLGARFYRSELGGMFPPAYNRTLFVAIHGSWNRALFAGYKVMAVQLDPANSSVVSYTTFMEGFLQGEGTPGNRIWGEPRTPLHLLPLSMLPLYLSMLQLLPEHAGATRAGIQRMVCRMCLGALLGGYGTKATASILM